MLEEIEISGTRVPSGSKKSGLLHVGEVPSSKFSVPFTVINGRKDGPILTVISGQHGTEYDAIAIHSGDDQASCAGEFTGMFDRRSRSQYSRIRHEDESGISCGRSL